MLELLAIAFCALKMAYLARSTKNPVARDA